MNNVEKKDLNQIAMLEAILFVYGEAIEIKKVSELLELDLKSAEALIKEYDLLLKNDKNRGLILLFNDEKIQLGTKHDLSFLVQKIVEKEINEDLTPAAIETLSLILYFGPISKSKIDYHRGVDSGFILRNLMLKGLIERKPNPHIPNSYLYYPSIKIFKHLGISSSKDLPDYEKFQELNKQFELLKEKDNNKDLNAENFIENNLENEE